MVLMVSFLFPLCYSAVLYHVKISIHPSLFNYKLAIFRNIINYIDLFYLHLHVID